MKLKYQLVFIKHISVVVFSMLWVFCVFLQFYTYVFSYVNSFPRPKIRERN